ncbi:uncharacterized protein LOC126374065 [Pectinophora gossypiella]|nr:uncharacterized protein LOC126374065 [Pectinophora gossypiella]
MVLADFLTETRRRWLKAFKLFKRSKTRKTARNRISPELIRSPSYSGTVDARAEIDLQRFCACRASMPPLQIANESFENNSYNSSYSYDSSRNNSIDGCHSDAARSDSAYNSARSSPAHARSVCYATVTYFNVNDSEDSSSIRTEFTLLDADADIDDEEEDERAQNLINESIELVSTL